jgi:hypothetical protein
VVPRGNKSQKEACGNSACASCPVVSVCAAASAESRDVSPPTKQRRRIIGNREHPLSVLGVGNSHIRLHQQGSIVEGERNEGRERVKASRPWGFGGFDMDLRIYTCIYLK